MPGGTSFPASFPQQAIPPVSGSQRAGCRWAEQRWWALHCNRDQSRWSASVHRLLIWGSASNLCPDRIITASACSPPRDVPCGHGMQQVVLRRVCHPSLPGSAGTRRRSWVLRYYRGKPAGRDLRLCRSFHVIHACCIILRADQPCSRIALAAEGAKGFDMSAA